MLFVEFRFLVFFLIVVAVYWTLRSNTWRKAWLLLASHFFYACFFVGDPLAFVANVRAGAWDKLPTGWWFPSLLWCSTVVDYAVGLGIDRSQTRTARRAWLLASLTMNLGVLGFFKYFNFFLGNAAAFFDWLQVPHALRPLDIFLPYGISFYTFQSLSYSIEVYRGALPAQKNFLNLSFFIAFFPQLVAGPIVRAMKFLPQTFEKRVWSNVDVRACATLFFIGFVKKACISDSVARVVDAYFAAPSEYDAYSAWVAVVLYAVQIYCDFSGYTDMAIATARLLGYELTQNFNSPYFSTDVTDFWRRWHMSLSSWLRDYLYIPLGGNRGSTTFTYRNLMLTMLLGGLWHGAAWNFVAWGGFHGLALIVHREWQRFADKIGWVRGVVAWCAVPLTFYWVCIMWILFRAQPVRDSSGQVVAGSVTVARTVLESFVLLRSPGHRSFSITCVWVLVGLAVAHWISSRQVLAKLWRQIPDWVLGTLLGLGTALALAFVRVDYRQFIYFQF